MGQLKQFLPTKTYAVVCTYRKGEIEAQVGGATIYEDDHVSLFFPKSHNFVPGDAVTLHLDDRTGVEALDIHLRVFRGSYKGLVTDIRPDRIEVSPVEFQLFHGTRVVAEFCHTEYRFPPDRRPLAPLPVSTLTALEAIDEKEQENKLGIWITRAEERPHTTVMAFLSTAKDDIFLLSHEGTFKSSCIRKDRRCCFAIDHRATFLFEKALDWNFTIIKAEASLIVRDSPLFHAVQGQFIAKNPWEEPFFTDPKIELFHLKPLGLFRAGNQDFTAR